jgi:hypothetical protein
MSESGVVGLSGRRSRSEADRLAAEFEQSGMTRTAFCRVHGISTHRLDYYRRMLRSRVGEASHLLPVELAGPSGLGSLRSASPAVPLRVELNNGLRIVVEEGFSAPLLKSLIAALEN